MRQDIKKKRGGFTLIEVILAIVVVAVIMGIVIPKVMSNSDKAQIKQVISSDVRSIVQAAADWKRTDQSTSDGTYANIQADLLDSRLPSNLPVDTTNHNVKSSGFHNGCLFALVKDASDGSTFKMGMDCSDAATKLSWSNKLKSYAKEAFFDTAKSLSSSATQTTSGSIGNVDCTKDTSSCATGITQ